MIGTKQVFANGDSTAGEWLPFRIASARMLQSAKVVIEGGPLGITAEMALCTSDNAREYNWPASSKRPMYL
jgi:hypothetical protein